MSNPTGETRTSSGTPSGQPTRGWKASINAQALRLLGTVKGILIVGYVATFAIVIWPAFDSLQHDEAARNLSRVLEAIQGEKIGLERSARDFSAWDVTYEYVKRPTKDYDHQTFTVDVMKDLGVEVIAIYDTKGHLVKGKMIDSVSGEDIVLTRFAPKLPLGHPLLSTSPTEHSGGITKTEKGLMLIASFPILQSSRTGPSRGTFIFGRLLSDTLIKKLAEQTHVQFELLRADQADLPAQDRLAAKQLSNGSKTVFGEATGTHLNTYALLPTLLKGAPLLVKSSTPTTIRAIGWSTLLIASVLSAAIAALGLLVSWIMLKRLIVGPLNALTNHVVEVGQSGDLSRRITMDRDDEIGVLSHEFNAAVEQLENVRRRLLERSYQSGMAEIAAGVIHNVRNALTPIAVTLSHLSEVAVTAPADHLDKAFADLKSGTESPKRHKSLVAYVEAAMKSMTDRGAKFAEELKGIAEQHRHIEQILHEHTSLSMGKRGVESVELARVVADATRFIPSQESTIVEIVVGESIATLPSVTGLPIVIAQILGNLLVNAAESIRATERGRGKIEIDATVDKDQNRSVVHLVVRDDGSGIDAAILPNLFGRGFSTKKNKSGGVGLHWSANSIAAMGGQMYAESRGPGLGATFHVLIPVASHTKEIAA